MDASGCVKTGPHPVPISAVDFARQFVECHSLTDRHSPEVESPLIHREAVGVYIPGMGAVLTLLVVFLTGLATTNIIGQRLVVFWEGVLWRIPVVKSIYYGVKQVSDTLFSSQGEAFRKALLVQ